MDFVYLNYNNQAEKNNEQSFTSPDVFIEIPDLAATSTENTSIEIPNNILLNNDLDVPSNNIIPEQIDLSLNNLTNVPMLISDPEYIDEITCVAGGRKKKIIHQKQLKKIAKNHIENNWQLNNCSHIESPEIVSVCKVSKLTHDDINIFKNKLTDISEKVKQDRFLLDMMSVSKVKRTDRRKTNRKERILINYFIPTKEGDKYRVCLNAFSSITSIKRKRLNIIARNFKTTQLSPTEKRGGSRVSTKSEEITRSIIDHILAFKVKKSHHTRKDSNRSYLQPGLSVNIMYKVWKCDKIKNNKPVASFSKYYNIFVSKFNLAFGHPRQDVCSYCTDMKTKIEKELEQEKREEIKTDLQIHKKKSKLFFMKMAEKKEKVVSVSFDMMQTQPLPKLSVTDVFYCRQVWLYNITFVINSEGVENRNTCHTYTWLETESGRGPNELCSALISFLSYLEDKIKQTMSPDQYPETLNLFSDSCSAQNKNKYMITTLLYYINYKSSVFKTINHTFPVRGHSYMPPDRIFGRIE